MKKTRQCNALTGAMLGMSNAFGIMRSIILNKSPTTAKQFGRYAWNAQCVWDHAQHNTSGVPLGKI